MLGALLFGAPVLYSAQPIPREDVPQGWYCYDLRGTARHPDEPHALVDLAIHWDGRILVLRFVIYSIYMPDSTCARANPPVIPLSQPQRYMREVIRWSAASACIVKYTLNTPVCWS